MKTTENKSPVPRWGCIDIPFESAAAFNNPLQDAALKAVFTSPSGQKHEQDGFWDGGTLWRVRFSPVEEGTWQYTLALNNAGEQSGAFVCGPPEGDTCFNRHGPLRISDGGKRLAHADGTPFFWLADTAWNGALRSTDEEWDLYIRQRLRQKFTAVQWVATHWRAAPDGDIEGNPAFTGKERIAVNPAFFQRLDRRINALVTAGLLPAPVLLWAIGSKPKDEINPGYGLPEDQAVLLARYMVARWGAHPAVWILGGDGDYRAEKANRWKTIGRAVFHKSPHAPVAMHCMGRHWPADELRREPWMDILGYQSGHGDSDETLDWIVNGPPAQNEPDLFSINMEPCYENHIAYQTGKPHDAHSVRQAMYWSLLNAPTAGVTYGGHGVWGWDDGTAPPVDHPRTGTPLPWQKALTMPAAEQMAHLNTAFTGISWWRLRPAPDLLAEQPGKETVRRHISASRSESGDLAVLYTPQRATVSLNANTLKSGLPATWFDPRTGARTPAGAIDNTGTVRLESPGDGDWLLVIASP